MQYWLMKSEPTAYSIEDLKKDKTTPWDGIRNYQARNFMRDKMEVGDKILFYHSNAKPTGIVGLGEIISKAYPDFTAWDKTNKHFDPKSTPEKPIWVMVDVGYVKTFTKMLTLEEMKNIPELKGMLVTKRGQRLSIQPVEKEHYDWIVNYLEKN